MARTKASVGAKVASGKSSKARCSAAPAPSTSNSSGSSKKTRSYGGGNSVCPQETPKWQRPITNFFINKTPPGDDGPSGSSSTSRPKPKRNIIESDDDDVEIVDKPKNTELDETLDLEPLTGDESRKIEEFFPKNETKNGTKDAKITQNGNNKESDNENDSTKDQSNNDLKGKGKGKGKKTKEKENIDTNTDSERRKSVKRDLEDVTNGEISPQSSKKIKVN